jgi:hypothetical protein
MHASTEIEKDANGGINSVPRHKFTSFCLFLFDGNGDELNDICEKTNLKSSWTLTWQLLQIHKQENHF